MTRAVLLSLAPAFLPGIAGYSFQQPGETYYLIVHVIRAGSDWTPQEIADTFRGANELWARYGNVRLIAWPQRILNPGDAEIVNEEPRPAWAEFVNRNVVPFDQLGVVTTRGTQISIITDPKLRDIVLAHEFGHYFALGHTNGDDPFGRPTIMQSPLPVGPLSDDYDPEPYRWISPEQASEARRRGFGSWNEWYRESSLPERYRNLVPGYVPVGADAPPTVRLSNPSDGSTVTGTVIVSASANDDRGIASVQFLVDGTNLSADTAAPYEAIWETSSATDGAHTIHAIATDTAGQSTSAQVTVFVSNPVADAPPSVRILSPEDGATVSGAVTISASASDDRGVGGVRFYVDGALLSEDGSAPFEAVWDSTTSGGGVHTIAAEAVDTGGQTSRAQVSVTAVLADADAPPTVRITQPNDGASVRGTVTISAAAEDDRPGLAVRFAVDGNILGEDATAPFEVSWDSSGAANGGHILLAEAIDSAGQTARAQVAVTVDNAADGPPSVRITAPADNSTVQGVVSIAAAASDDRGVQFVEFFADDRFLSSDGSAPYEATLDTRTLPGGSHVLRARAVDSAGQASSASITVIVNNAPAQDQTAAIDASDAGNAWEGDGRFYPSRDPFNAGTDGGGRMLLGLIRFDLAGRVPPGATITRLELEMTGAMDIWGLPAGLEWTCDLLGDATAGAWDSLTFRAIRDAAALGRFAPVLRTSDLGQGRLNRLSLDTNVPAGNALAVRVNGPVTSGFSYYGWSGASSSARPRLRVTYRDSAPQVAITSPSEGDAFFLGAATAVAGQVRIAVDAKDDVGVAAVDIFIGSSRIARLSAPPYECVWNTTKVPGGWKTIEAVATDVSGQSSSHAIRVMVDREAPRMAVQAPPDGAPVRGRLTVRVSAKDNFRLDRVEIYCDDALIGTAPSGEFEGELDTRQLSNGAHTLRFVATDGVGNKVESSSRIRVFNVEEGQGPSQGPLPPAARCPRTPRTGGGVAVRIRIIVR